VKDDFNLKWQAGNVHEDFPKIKVDTRESILNFVDKLEDLWSKSPGTIKLANFSPKDSPRKQEV